jgi:hypothetical protein
MLYTDTAAALVRALQCMEDSWDYKLPEGGESFEINDPPYRLLGWLIIRARVVLFVPLFRNGKRKLTQA